MALVVTKRRPPATGTAGQAIMRPRPRRLHRLGSALLAAGLVLAVLTAADFAYGIVQQHQLDQAWHQWRQTHTVPTNPQTPDPAWLHPVGGVDFVISLPKLGYSAAVGEGVGTASLAAGPGHYPSMAWPGQVGNVGVAAHNGYWIHFDQLKPGDMVVVQTRWGNFVYLVAGSRVVEPTDRSVLVPTHDRRLTMTTCWPLWAGAFASQRLVVTAIQVTPHRPDVLPQLAVGASPGDEVWVVGAILAGVVIFLGALLLKRRSPSQ